MKKYVVENMGKYVKNMKNYAENMKKCVGICGNVKKYLEIRRNMRLWDLEERSTEQSKVRVVIYTVPHV